MRRALEVVLVGGLRRAAAPAAGSPRGDGGGGKRVTLYAANEVGLREGDRRTATSRPAAATRSSYVRLPTDADQQRELLVRRLAAEDTDIDIIGMDVIWTAEFAEAGWISASGPAPSAAKAARDGRLEGPLRSATYQDKLWAAPFTTNTQLLWYRKDRVKQAAQDLGRDDRHGQEARREQGQDRGPGRALRGPHRVVQLARRVGRRPDPRRGRQASSSAQPAGRGRGDHASASPLGRPPTRRCPTQGGHRRGCVRDRRAGLHGQLPVRLPEREGGGARTFQKNIGCARYPRSTPTSRSRVDARRHQPRRGDATRRTRSWRSRPPSACAAREPAHRRAEGRPAADAPRRSTTTRRSRRPTRFADADARDAQGRRAAPGHARPTATSRWRSRRRCTRPASIEPERDRSTSCATSSRRPTEGKLF